jgi:predicted deacetylase
MVSVSSIKWPTIKDKLFQYIDCINKNNDSTTIIIPDKLKLYHYEPVGKWVRILIKKYKNSDNTEHIYSELSQNKYLKQYLDMLLSNNDEPELIIQTDYKYRLHKRKYYNLKANHNDLENENEYKSIKRRCDELQSNNESLQANHNDLENEYKSIKRTCDELQSNNESLQVNHDEVNHLYNNLKDKYQSLENELQSDMDNKCAICLSNPSVYGFQHGRTVHNCICKGCIVIYTNTSIPNYKNCPICDIEYNRIVHIF